jgi:AraC-like DNA-binding protein
MHEKSTNKQTSEVKPIMAYKCEQAVRLLEEQVADIPDVQTWAADAGVSRRWLCKSMKKVVGKLPKIFHKKMIFKSLDLQIVFNKKLNE